MTHEGGQGEKQRVKTRLDGLARVQVSSRSEWRQWLAGNHARQTSIWLVTYKKSSGKATLSYGDIVEEALCFGWVDSLPRKLDDERTMLLISPRKAKSAWSKINKERVAKLLHAGLVAPPGLAKIEAAKADGSWDTLNEVDALAVPDDLAAALAGYAGAAEQFARFPPSVRRGILEWIGAAKREETRAKRVEETARLAGQGIRANQWRK